jgi:DNA-binding NarL/FixJ family response regulator
MALKTILVEDNGTIRASLIPAMAELADVQVIVTAETANEGVAALQAHAAEWQLTVVDLYLREGTGLAVLRAGEHRAPHQHMIVLTNYATPEVRRRCLDAGADAVFDKSTEIEPFLEKCRSYLSG